MTTTAHARPDCGNCGSQTLRIVASVKGGVIARCTSCGRLARRVKNPVPAPAPADALFRSAPAAKEDHHMQIETCKHCDQEIERQSGLALLMGGWEAPLADEPEHCDDAPRVDCDECGGAGEVEHAYDTEFVECPECDGAGDLPGEHEPAL